MKLNTATVLKSLDGLAITDGYQTEDENGKRVEKVRDLTVGLAISAALVTGAEEGDRRPLTPQEKFESYMLAMKIRENEEVTLTSEQVTLCKNAITQSYKVIIAGQVISMLEPDLKKVPKKRK